MIVVGIAALQKDRRAGIERAHNGVGLLMIPRGELFQFSANAISLWVSAMLTVFHGFDLGLVR
jgi:hypothetical protein